MRKLLEKEKEELQAKIEDERLHKHQKERKLLAYKNSYSKLGPLEKRLRHAPINVLQDTYSQKLRAEMREKAFSHIFDKDEQLRNIKIDEKQKDALVRKIAEQHQATVF